MHQGQNGTVAEAKHDLAARLRRIEGQVKRLQRMVEDERSCIEIITQVNAVQSAVRGAALVLLENHLRQCLRSGGNDGERQIHEVVTAAERLLRSV